MRDYARLEDAIGYRFKDARRLELALTHKTYAHEHPDERTEDNARLEFLGDAVIELAVRRHFFDARVPIPRATMSEHADKIVNNATLAEIAKAIGLPTFADFGKGDKNDKLSDNPDVHAAILEAVMGAVSKDSDIETACVVTIALFRKHAPEKLGGA